MRALNFMSRGELASRGGVGIETVRFYEQRGLLRKPLRTSAGYRQYDDAALSRLRFIQRAKTPGFSLDEVRELVALRLDATTDCRRVQQRAEEKLTEIRRRIRDLERMQAALERLTSACRRNSRKMDCPLIAALESRDAP